MSDARQLDAELVVSNASAAALGPTEPHGALSMADFVLHPKTTLRGVR